jgi:hypothetical protein
MVRLLWGLGWKVGRLGKEDVERRAGDVVVAELRSSW